MTSALWFGGSAADWAALVCCRCVWELKLKTISTWWKSKVSRMMEKAPKSHWPSSNHPSCPLWVHIMMNLASWSFYGSKWPSSCLLPPFPAQMSLGGFEIMPPVTFRLQAGSGPVHISGQHFIREYSLFTNTDEHIQKMFTGWGSAIGVNLTL